MLNVGESGKILRVAAAYNMSSATEITLNIAKPSGVSVSKTKTGGQVTLGGGVTDATLGALGANEYVEYSFEVGVLDESGQWSVRIVYEVSTDTPPTKYIGDLVYFTVDS